MLLPPQAGRLGFAFSFPTYTTLLLGHGGLVTVRGMVSFSCQTQLALVSDIALD